MLKSQSIIVIDDFYHNPIEIRKHALSLDYKQKNGATYPGMEATSERNWEIVRNTLMSYINEDVSAPCPKSDGFAQGKFRIAVANDNKKRLDNVHVDQQKYSGIIYLTPNVLCQGGVAFYKHKKTGEVFFNKTVIQSKGFPTVGDDFHKRVLSYFKDDNNWDKIGEIPMRFNRAVIIMARVFHGSTGIFGDSMETGRLTQHFEFYTYDK
ncbi:MULTISPECIES: DUF6445 family protein [Xenorhabdus]|uniref:Uncharacterized protein n=1 Tax=Xenorhabdus ehlersii TaxID=290111 RepID=A0A2D0IXK4_9GAMM|nr:MULTISPECIES: DUF6445 family protein [Xenorhabdus]MBC8949992.1 hypothetical protein [Xenorhabdus sp. TS4]PHM26648.1 hypothetical protein Xehl_00322 [Xenorhabdus ehlersii]RKE93174.1 hypothetical protein BDE27_0885 [Xenorhabdus ehlersii]